MIHLCKISIQTIWQVKKERIKIQVLRDNHCSVLLDITHIHTHTHTLGKWVDVDTHTCVFLCSLSISGYALVLDSPCAFVNSTENLELESVFSWRVTLENYKTKVMGKKSFTSL